MKQIQCIQLQFHHKLIQHTIQIHVIQMLIYNKLNRHHKVHDQFIQFHLALSGQVSSTNHFSFIDDILQRCQSDCKVYAHVLHDNKCTNHLTGGGLLKFQNNVRLSECTHKTQLYSQTNSRSSLKCLYYLKARQMKRYKEHITKH